MAKKSKNKSKSVASTLLPVASAMEPEDDNLMDDLLAQLDSKAEEESAVAPNEVQPNKIVKELEAKPKQSAKDRFQARQARRAAALAQNVVPDDPEVQARLEKEARDEEEAINKLCQHHGREIFQINPDGHCLYSAVADQLALLGKLPGSQATYSATRAAAANYIESHADHFLPFLPVPEEDTAGETGTGLMSPQQFQHYCSTIRSTAVWGGEPEVQALSRAFNIPIHVIQDGVPPIVLHDPSENTGTDGTIQQGGIWLSYHRRMYGLGEHYNSLRPTLMS
ncbi:OTU-domain-containing protein [Macrolepiota fuliginosa MF-IS2]|uniref:OTU-domain-containing protein n=1 Tax=Macrolepiota fuliginosa MF-IS2 TaxID=1400762 RepID=A0A9P6C7D7_9AGAR|nr:OTU-domain-containing protein [Macrolepiota fuliginosa MF-IS2]